MKREKSCGAVICADTPQGRLFLVEQMHSGHFGLCKGHVEAGETEEETALREIREETGLEVTLDTGFRREICYSPFAGCHKQVVFFAAHAQTLAVCPQPEEIRAILWLPLEEAANQLTHPSSREVLLAAGAYWESRSEI